MSSGQWGEVVEVGGDGEDEYWVFDNAVSTTAISRIQDFPTSQSLVLDSSFRDESIFSYSSWLLTTEMDELFAEEQQVSDLIKGSSASSTGTESESRGTLNDCKRPTLQGTEVVLADRAGQYPGNKHADSRDDNAVMLYTRRKKKQELSSASEASRPMITSSEEDQSSSNSSSSVLSQDSGSILLTPPTGGGLRGRMKLPRRRPRRANIRAEQPSMDISQSCEETMSPSPLAPQKVQGTKSDEYECQSAVMPLLKSPTSAEEARETVVSRSCESKTAMDKNRGFGKLIRPIFKKPSIKRISQEYNSGYEYKKRRPSFLEMPSSSKILRNEDKSSVSGKVKGPFDKERDRSIQSLVSKIVNDSAVSQNDTSDGVLSPRSERPLVHLALVSVTSSTSEDHKEQHVENYGDTRCSPTEDVKQNQKSPSSFPFNPNDPVLLAVSRILREESQKKLSGKDKLESDNWPEYDPSNPILLEVKRELQSKIRSYLSVKQSHNSDVTSKHEELLSVDSLLRKSNFNIHSHSCRAYNDEVHRPATKEKQTTRARTQHTSEFQVESLESQSHVVHNEKVKGSGKDDKDRVVNEVSRILRSPESDFRDIQSLLKKEENEPTKEKGEENGMKFNRNSTHGASSSIFDPFGLAEQQHYVPDQSLHSSLSSSTSHATISETFPDQPSLKAPMLCTSDSEADESDKQISANTVNLFGLPFVTFPEHVHLGTAKSDNKCDSPALSSRDSPCLRNSSELDTPFKLSCDSLGEDKIQMLQSLKEGASTQTSRSASNSEKIGSQILGQVRSKASIESRNAMKRGDEESFEGHVGPSLLKDVEALCPIMDNPEHSSETRATTKTPFIRVNVSSLSEGHPLDDIFASETFKTSKQMKDKNEECSSDWWKFPSPSQTLSLPQKTSLKEGPSKDNLHVHFGTMPTERKRYSQNRPLSLFQSRHSYKKPIDNQGKDAPPYGFNATRSNSETFVVPKDDELPECKPFPVDFEDLPQKNRSSECESFPVEFKDIQETTSKYHSNYDAVENFQSLFSSVNQGFAMSHDTDSTLDSSETSFQFSQSSPTDACLLNNPSTPTSKTRSCPLNFAFRKTLKVFKSHTKTVQRSLKKKGKASYNGVHDGSELSGNIWFSRKVSRIPDYIACGEGEQISSGHEERALDQKTEAVPDNGKSVPISSQERFKSNGSTSCETSCDDVNVTSSLFHKDNIIAHDSSSSRSKASTDRSSHSLPLSVQSDASFTSGQESDSAAQRKLSKDSSGDWLDSKSKLSKSSSTGSGLMSKTKMAIENLNALRRQVLAETDKSSSAPKQSLNWKPLKDKDDPMTNPSVTSVRESSSRGSLRKFFLRTATVVMQDSSSNYGSIADTDVVSAWSLET